MGEAKAAPEIKSLGATIWEGITGRCPSCGGGKLFDGYLKLAHAAIRAVSTMTSPIPATGLPCSSSW